MANAYILFSHRASYNAVGGPSGTLDNTFAIGTISTEDADSTSIASRSGDQMILPTGTYRVRGIITFGHSGSMLGLQGRAVLWDETNHVVLTNAGTGTTIVSTPIVASTASATPSTLANATCEIAGRFTLAGSTAITIRIAGKGNSETWATNTGAQGGPAINISSGSYNNVFKQLEFLQE